MTSSGQGLATRFILLSGDAGSLRGTRAEFLHFGLPLTRHVDPLEALADLAHDPCTALIIAAEPELEQVEHILELACAISERSVYLAVRDSTSEGVISAAIRAGVQGTFALPLTPHGLREALPTHLAVRSEDHRIQLGDLVVHLDQQSVSWKGAMMVLPTREFMLLRHIALAYPDPIRMDTLTVAYGVDPGDRGSSVRAAIARLRKRLRDIDPAADFIRTVQFTGYCLSA